MAHDVFISYSSSNKPVADAVCAGLEAEGIRCWIAPRDVLPGQNYGESIVHAIAACKVMVLVFSGATNVSQAVIREAERAMHHSKPIIPFRIEDVPMSPGLEFFLASCHWLDAMSPPLDAHIGSLASSVKRLTGEEPAPAPLPVPLPLRPVKTGMHQTGVAVAAALILAAAGFFVFRGARENEAPAETPELVAEAAVPSLDVALAGEWTGAIAGHFSPDDGPRYQSSRAAGVLAIECAAAPAIGKLTVVRPATRASWLQVPPLDLDLKLLNPGPGTVFLQRAVLEVKSSQAIPGTAWLVDGSRLGSVFAVRALGEPPEQAPRLALGIAGPEDEVDPARAPQLTAASGGNEGPWEFTLPAAPRPGVEQVLFGRLDEVAFELPFATLPAAKPRPALEKRDPLYEIDLRSEGRDYSVACDLSQSIQAGEGDRFFLRLRSPERASHEFQLALEYNDGGSALRTIKGPTMKVELLPEPP